MSLIKAIKAQLGLSGDPTKNFTFEVPAAPDGTMKLARNSGQDIMTVAADGKVAFPATPAVVPTPVSGEVLQVVWRQDAGTNLTAPGSLQNMTNSLIQIIPKSTNSTLIVELNWNGGVQNQTGVNASALFQLHRGTVASPIGYATTVTVPSGAGGNGIQSRQMLSAFLNNTDLTTKQFGLGGALSAGSGVLIYGTSQNWKITEVQN